MASLTVGALEAREAENHPDEEACGAVSGSPVVFHDNYYKAHDDLAYGERCLLNYDHPDASDNDLMVKHLRDSPRGSPLSVRFTTTQLQPVRDRTRRDRARADHRGRGILIRRARNMRAAGHQNLRRHRRRILGAPSATSSNAADARICGSVST